MHMKYRISGAHDDVVVLQRNMTLVAEATVFSKFIYLGHIFMLLKLSKVLRLV